MAKKNEVIKHSSTIQISNIVTLVQRKVWNVLLANAYNDIPTDTKKFHISISQLSDYLNYEDRNDKHLKDSLEGLLNTKVKWNVLNRDGSREWGASTLLAGCRVANGICEYDYSIFLREILYNPKVFARLNINIQNKFQSKHSLALYELCIDYLGSKREEGETPFIELEKFRTLMGLNENEYLHFKDLNKKLIKAPIKEINDVSDLNIDVKYKKDQRKVVAIKFMIKRKYNDDSNLLLDTSYKNDIVIESSAIDSKSDQFFLTQEQKHIFDKLFEIGITKISANELIKNYSLDNIRNQIEWLKYRNPNDAAAMLIQSIKEDWTIPNEAKKNN